MTLLAANEYRVLITHGRAQTIKDRITSEELKVPVGVDVNLYFGISRTNSDFYDLSNVVSAKLELKDYGANTKFPLPGDPTLISKTLAAVDIVNEITKADWEDNAAHNFLFELSAAETALPLGGDDSKGYALILSGVLASGKKVSFGWGKVLFVQDGTGSDPDVDPVDPAYVTDGDLAAYIAKAAHRPVVSMPYFGNATDEQTWGNYKSRIAQMIVGIDLFLQSVHTGAAFQFALIVDGVELAPLYSIISGQASSFWNVDIDLAVDDVVELIVKQVGSTNPGGYITAQLHLAPA